MTREDKLKRCADCGVSARIDRARVVSGSGRPVALNRGPLNADIIA